MSARHSVFAESAWESISARVMADTRRPVLVVPGHIPSDEEPESID